MYSEAVGSLIWLGIAVAFAVAELAVGEFTFLMIAAGALTTSAIALAEVPLGVEIGAFVVASAGFWFLLRPYLHRRLRRPSAVGELGQSLIGASAQVVEEITPSSGQIQLDGSLWSARAIDPSHTIKSGSTVIVSDIDGPIAVVWKESP
nr:NfeD family protein [Corynebacterium sp. CCUG 51687]